MSGTSSKTLMVSFRLSNKAHTKILKALASPRNGNTSVSDYCKQIIERYAFRHERKDSEISSQVSVLQLPTISTSLESLESLE